jgi:DNA (cytosine-5)-methyltransferase 1
MKSGTLFSGGGGADLGISSVMGEESMAWAIERDRDTAMVFRDNFPHTKMLVSDVHLINPESLEPVDLLHASPPCQQYSSARKVKTQHRDADAGLYCSRYIKILQPIFFTLENVPGYVNSESFRAIINCLHKNRYFTQWQVCNASDYGCPQDRKRLILRASKSMLPPLTPSSDQRQGWYSVIKDLIADLPCCELAQWQQKRIQDVRDRPLLLPRAGSNVKTVKPRTAEKPSFTIRSMAAWGGTHCGDIVLSDGVTKKLTIEAIARLCAFPDSYQLPSRVSLSQKILGNSVLPPMMAAVVRSLVPLQVQCLS